MAWAQYGKMSTMRRTIREIAWAAGLFEGEGCFSSSVRKDGKTNVITCLTTTDEDVARRFFYVVGIGSMNRREQGINGYKPLFVWQAGGYENMRHVFSMLGPYLGERRTARVLGILNAQPAPYERANVPPRCGRTTMNSGSGAVRHERLGELPCMDCARERAAYTRGLRKKQREARNSE